ncbi:MAG: MoxR family ATPase [Planctomycetota bacterium]|nr:MAG: MoxR family ATPase [Planctomycetota bacterium]
MSTMQSDPTAVHQGLAKLQANIEQAVLGKPEVVRLVIAALLAGEHILLEDVPGVGKTLIAKALARSIDGKFTRVQFTPDLLPSDITGSSIYHSSDGSFSFNPGPVFSNVVLADEINRAPPRTQSALLEAMGERQVSVDGETHALPDPLLVIATQNPFEFEGTYLLPESQLDRFLLRITVGYPPREVEHELLQSHRMGEPVVGLAPVVSLEEVRHWQRHVRSIHFDEDLVSYLLDIVHATRESPDIQVGVSTRGAISYYRAAQALAVVDNRSHVIPDDVKRLAVPVLAHRIVPRGALPGADRSSSESLVRDIVDSIRVPV